MANDEQPNRRAASPKRVMKRIAAQSHAGHSDMYRWLRRRHALIQEAFDKHDPSWLTISETMVAEGVKGRGGCRPTAGSVRKAWARVCRDIRDEAHFQAFGVVRKRQVSSRPVALATTGPSITSAVVPDVPVASVQASHSALANSAASEIGDTKPGVAGPVGREVARARLAEIRRTLSARSGR